jgi:hypothetical protein
MPFAKGQSGNPAGRPPGSRNRTTLFMEALLSAQAEEVMCAAIAKAREGDAAALRLCFDRLLPRGNDRPVPFALPVVETAADARSAISRIMAATGTGELTPPQALSLMRVVEKGAQIIVATEVAEKARDAAWRREQMELWSEPEQRREREERRDGERREKAAREAAERETAEQEQAAREDWARRVAATIMVDDDDAEGGAGGATEGPAAPPAKARRAAGGRRRGSAAGGGPSAGRSRRRAANKAGSNVKARRKPRRTGAGANRGATSVDSAEGGPAPATAIAPNNNACGNNNARGNNENTMQRAAPAVTAPLLQRSTPMRHRGARRIPVIALAGAAPGALVPVAAGGAGGRMGGRMESWLAAILRPVAVARAAFAGGGALSGPLPVLP